MRVTLGLGVLTCVGVHKASRHLQMSVGPIAVVLSVPAGDQQEQQLPMPLLGPVRVSPAARGAELQVAVRVASLWK